MIRDRGTIARTAALAVLGGMVLAPAVASAAPADTYYDRAAISAANVRCRLFDPQVSGALAAGVIQARNGALRAGVEPAELARLKAEADLKGASVDCASPDLRAIADKVKAGFEGYSRLTRISFPGDAAAWKADRTGLTWALSQPVTFGGDRMTLGIARGNSGAQALVAQASFAGGAVPYAARIVVRDPRVAPSAFTAKGPLPRRAATGGTAQAFSATSRVGGTAEGVAFAFPAAAKDALAALDPREAATVEFLFSGRNGESVKRAYVEVGDFAAGQAFLNVARR
ncbi:MAG: hypothetical protein ACXW3D_03495 [Caulobacteraceae bacterium]